jgi:hypothetical protein
LVLVSLGAVPFGWLKKADCLRLGQWRRGSDALPVVGRNCRFAKSVPVKGQDVSALPKWAKGFRRFTGVKG